MNENLPQLLSKEKVDALCKITSRDIRMLERNFEARVPRDMAGRVDYLDDGKATLGQRREKMAKIHHTIQHDKDLEDMVSLKMYKDILASTKCWAVLLTMEWDQLNEFHHVLRTGDAKTKRSTLHDFLMACSNVGRLIWWNGFRCVFTNAAINEECHVCPFWTLSRRSQIQLTVIAPLRAILGEELSRGLLTILDQREVDGDNQLHKMWDDGVFGLEPIRRRQEYYTAQEAVTRENPGARPSAVKRGAKPAEDQPLPKRHITRGGNRDKQPKLIAKENVRLGIELRFQWLKRTNLGGLGDNPPKPDADPRGMWDNSSHDQVYDNGHATPLESGHTITIWSEDPQKIPNWELVSLQWLAFRLHRLSGAADVDLYAPQKDQDDDEALACRVVQAKRQATEMIAERLGLDPDELWADPRGPYYVPPKSPRPHAD
ncbi:hypothetical protein LX36DRAFT_689990 [Colletotrichum falcatum]|nr:hypothetical protein LX36DRAFT_689990 [Colletotrichum falcatum]